MKTLILYYSYGGNTRRVAQMIQKEVGGDLAEIQTVQPYTGDYNAVVDQGQREIDSGFCPELKPLTVDLKDYDTVVLGSPVWWYTFAPAVHSFLKEADLVGKRVYPFATNGGWLGHPEGLCQGLQGGRGQARPGRAFRRRPPAHPGAGHPPLGQGRPEVRQQRKNFSPERPKVWVRSGDFLK